jgi:phosphate acetyltransferase
MRILDTLAARARVRPRRILFPESGDPRVLEAVAELQRTGWVEPLLLGDAEPLRGALEAVGGDPDAIRILPGSGEGVGDGTPGTSALAAHLHTRRRAKGMSVEEARVAMRDPLLRAGALVALGGADGAVAGSRSPTGDVIRAGLWCVGMADGVRTVSSSFHMVLGEGRDERVLTFTDCAVVPDPDPVTLAHIAASAARARRQVFGDAPVVAFLSYSTRGSAEGPSVTRVREALRHFFELEPGIPADGEFQADAALVESVARRKAPDSAVGGSANVLVFPNLDAGNIGYKLVERLAGARAIGPILQGLERPWNDLSRGATAEDIVQVAVITSLMAR